MLTITNIVNAYRRSGLKPVTGMFCDGRKCGCALTALYCSQHKVHPIDRATKLDTDEDIIINDWANAKYGNDFADGLMSGFDDVKEVNQPNQYDKKIDYKHGYWLGRKAFKELKKYYKNIK